MSAPDPSNPLQVQSRHTHRSSNGFAYSPLPPLPWDLGTGALTAIGSRVFVVGGADCGSPPNTERYITWSDRHGRNLGIGEPH